ncbi:hypothetical protein OUZ56_003420 [Daphnia magna]|uniref:Uncharacterized protein n=1 Tax=Daphnia magna TaxID=35525 RepID=A0ABR0A930_9CRUS|nr:hypothetical protein OUZ56_003420 [Daphnia magna]
MGLFASDDCSTTSASKPLSIQVASSSMTFVTFTGSVCLKLACWIGIFITFAAGNTCGSFFAPDVLPWVHHERMTTLPYAAPVVQIGGQILDRT